MLEILKQLIIALVMRFIQRGTRDTAKHIEKDVQDAHKVETGVSRLPDGESSRLLKSKWKR